MSLSEIKNAINIHPRIKYIEDTILIAVFDLICIIEYKLIIIIGATNIEIFNNNSKYFLSDRQLEFLTSNSNLNIFLSVAIFLKYAAISLTFKSLM